ncbi:MAG TPA: phosphatase PAP2 family protein [Rickettsiales bacterium]|nr:phosphatase PAP2 family protein [Rickettsiales bacterium]
MLPSILYAPDSLNVQIFHAINNIQNAGFQSAMQALSALGNYKLFPLYLLLIVGWLALRAKNVRALQGAEAYTVYIKQARHLVISLVLCYVVYLVWVTGLKHLLSLPRPFAYLPEGTVFIKDSIRQKEEPFVSFPSGHSGFAMLMLVVFWSRLNGFSKIAGIALVLGIAVSRIALGVHFPSDVTGTLILSFIVTLLVLRLYRKYRPE